MVINNVLTVADFLSVLNNYGGRQLIHTPVTKTTSNETGDETLTEGTGVSIECYFMRMSSDHLAMKEGELNQADGVALTKFADSVGFNDLIHTDGTSITISNIDGDATTITVDTSSVHGLSVADEVLILGTTNYDGKYTVATITDTDTFTISDTNHDVVAETSGQIQTGFTTFRVDKAYDVPGVYDSTSGTTSMVYTRCDLYLSS